MGLYVGPAAAARTDCSSCRKVAGEQRLAEELPSTSNEGRSKLLPRLKCLKLPKTLTYTFRLSTLDEGSMTRQCLNCRFGLADYVSSYRCTFGDIYTADDHKYINHDEVQQNVSHRRDT